MIRLIREKNEWCKVVESAQNADFYHTFDYHRLSCQEDEHPVLVEYSEGDHRIALPLLFRNIPDSDLKDATSVYGYVGPLGINLNDNFKNKRFHAELIEFFNWNKVITVFSRLNPFIPNQAVILKDIGEISSPGRVVYIDLGKSKEKHWSEYNRRMRSYINRSREKYTIYKATTEEDVREFINTYYATMKRVKATERYFFKERYFLDLIESMDFQTELLLAKKKSDNSFAGGALFTKKKHIVQYHLSGAKDEVLYLNPIKMLIDEMRLQAIREGFRYLNLGGGVGNLEDSLFRFKSSFSKNCLDFNLWKLVVNPEIYNDLNLMFKGRVSHEFSDNCHNFFPFYRCDER